MGDKKGFLRGGTDDKAVSQDGKHAMHGAAGSHESTKQGGSRDKVLVGNPDELAKGDETR